MRAAVQFTHHQGERLGRGFEHPRGMLRGYVLSALMGSRGTHVVSLLRLENDQQPLAQLYSVRLVGIGSRCIRIAGVERHKSAWVHQEWLITPE